MAGGFTGTPEDFQKAFGDVSEIKGQMDSNIQKLRSNIEATRAGWDGEAGRAFQNVMDKFDEKSRNLNQRLQDIADLLEQSGHKYQAAEEEQQSTVGNLGAILDA